jgi:hypothetical protein
MIGIQKDLDAFSYNCSKNPFIFSPFIKYAMQSNIHKGWIPTVLVSRTEQKIIGFAPLLLKQHIGVRVATSLLKFWLSPDFIIDDEYRENALTHILYVLLKKMRCKSISLYLPAESPNLQVLERACIINGIAFRKKTEQQFGHRVIPIQCSWDDFQKARGGSFRQRFRRMERRLNDVGEWKITLVENTNDEQSTNDAFNKILDVEKMSWKETWRLQNKQTIDEDLLWIWKSSSSVENTNPDFKRKIWFLELNDQTVAYTLVIQYKGTAFACKTSYADQYRQLYLGVYVTNAAIKDLFNKKEVQRFDFMTNLPFCKIWSATYLPRVGYIISEGIVPNLFEHTIRNSRIGKVLKQNLPLKSLAKFAKLFE